jgi:hypothetical protein
MPNTIENYKVLCAKIQDLPEQKQNDLFMMILGWMEQTNNIEFSKATSHLLSNYFA